MLKRRILNSLYNGSGRQLLYLLGLCLGALGLLTLLSYALFNDGQLVWQDIVALFLDPGVFAGPGSHDWFRLVVALIGVLTFSSLLISLFTNLISNLADLYKNGEIFFDLRNHILIIGCGKQLVCMLRELSKNGSTCDIAILTDGNIGEMRVSLEHELGGDDVLKRIVYQKGDSRVPSDVETCRPWRALEIYVIGDPDDKNHDSTVMRCVENLKACCSESSRDIRCRVMLYDEISTDIFRRVNQSEAMSPLKIDYVPFFEYQAEQLLVYSDFLPVIKSGSNAHSHIVVFGSGQIARAVAFISAHISHYPNFDGGKNRTMISIVAPDIRPMMEDMVLSKRPFFNLCRWEYVSESADEKHCPAAEMGDYLDIEWQFIDSAPNSFFVNKLVESWATDESQELSIIAASDCVQDNVQSVLSLSRRAYSSRIAVYLSEMSGIIPVAYGTGLFGNIRTFGPASVSSDALCVKRSIRGRRVNFLYDQVYGNPKSKDADEAWYKIPEAHKFSSIYCADAMPLKKLCYDMTGNRMSAYEGEHRRWMTSVLLMGYHAMPLSESKAARADRAIFKALKSSFIHPDIAPFDMLPEEEKAKDAILIDAMDDIIN